MKPPKVAMITTWNSKCGIAEYTRLLCDEIKNKVDFTIYPNYGVELINDDESNVAKRLWHNSFSGDLSNLQRALQKENYDVLHFQFHYAFYKLIHLSALINDLSNDCRIIITFHVTKDNHWGEKIYSLESINNYLNLCYRLIVHQNEDKVRLIEMGVNERIVAVIPHGQIIYPFKNKSLVQKKLDYNRNLVIGSYGFLFPHKGIKENIESLVLIKNQYPDVLYIVTCALYGNAKSQNYLEECKNLTSKLGLNENVVFISEFLPNERSIDLLQACDVLIMAYHPTDESASGAIRFCIAAHRPIITTKQDIFDEFSECTYQIDKCASNEIADAVLKIMNESELSKNLVKNLKKRIIETSWEKVGEMTYSLYIDD